ncbi:MAG: phasin family protein [Rhodospirillales bacterium]
MGTIPMDTPNEQGGGARGRFEEPLVDVLRHVWWAGLGLAAVAGEQTGRVFDALVERGKQVEPTVVEQGKKAGQEVSEKVNDVGEKLKAFLDRVGRSAGAAEAAIDERAAAALERMGFPKKADLDALTAKIDALTARLEEMQRRG